MSSESVNFDGKFSGDGFDDVIAAMRDFYGGPEFVVAERFQFADRCPGAVGSLTFAQEVMAVRHDEQMQDWLGLPIYDALGRTGISGRSRCNIGVRLKERGGVFNVRDLMVVGRSGREQSLAGPAQSRQLHSAVQHELDAAGSLLWPAAATLDDLLMVCPTIDDVPGLVLGPAGRLPDYRTDIYQLTLGTILKMGASELRDTIDPHRTTLSTDHFEAAYAAGQVLAGRFAVRLAECEAIAGSSVSSPLNLRLLNRSVDVTHTR